MSTAVTKTMEHRSVALKPMLSPRLALRWPHVLLATFMAGLFLYLNYMPLYHTDIWGHVHWGQWMLEHGRIPAEDPFMPLAAGMTEVNTAWLSQVIFAGAQQLGGDEALSHLYALVVLGTYGILFRIFYLQTGRLALATCGILGVLFVVWSRHSIIRPEIFGGLCLATLLWLLVRVEPWRDSSVCMRAKPQPRGEVGLWVGIFALFAVWANLHGSFAAGLVVLAAIAAGTWIESAWRTRSFIAVLADRNAQRALIRLEVALVATLCNPYGWDLLLATARFGGNPNLREVLEWYPLRLVDLEGLTLSASVLLVMGGLRFSRRRIHLPEVFVFLALAGMTALRVRMINWYGPILFFLLMPHLASACRKLWPSRGPVRLKADDLTAIHFLPTLLCGLIVWTAFSLSPLSKPVLGGVARPAHQLYSTSTPVGATEYLQEHPTTGLIFGPQWWGDWLAMHGPAESSVFMTTHVHLAPRRVWTDYLTVARGQAGWQRILNKYGVESLIVHKQLQTQLAAQARGSGEWKTVYEDDIAMILKRN